MGATYTFGDSTTNLASAAAQTKYNNTNLAYPTLCLRIKGDAWTNCSTYQEKNLFLFASRNNATLRVGQTDPGVYYCSFRNDNYGVQYTNLTFTPSASTFYLIYLQYAETGDGGTYYAVANSSGTILDNSGVLFNGGLAGSTGEFELGPKIVAKGYTLDGCAIYSAVKTGAARFAVPTSGDSNIVGLYKFDEGSGTSVADATGGTSLTIAGSGTWNTNDGAWDGSTSLFRPYFITG
jgi:hypothetical protein